MPQYYLGLAGEVLLASGRPADGLALLDRAIAAIDEPGVGFYVPEIYRLRGECLLALGRGNKDEARQAFAAARDIAIRQGAIIFSAAPKHPLARLRIFGLSDSGSATVGSQRTARKVGSWHMVADSHAVVFCSVQALGSLYAPFANGRERKAHVAIVSTSEKGSTGQNPILKNPEGIGMNYVAEWSLR